ncbi:MAG: hypothetical protein DRJ26_02635 [Candidatus Methanomethylicota archaeon]|uniref:Uncharacterized protein n=1 Tax=Thermoproteota archaeon TaxID=2056631 RepID=A0A497F3V5_9CREN|nr:MAG: hypothetical protein DRJ26_02635 [Candidatus Verstraetearchaeota archaeon]
MAAETTFTTALELLEKSKRTRASTGIRDFDDILGGIEVKRSYLFYSNGGVLADLLALKIAVNSLLPLERGGLGGQAIIIACSDYRSDRTIVDTYFIGECMKSAGLEPEEHFKRISIAGCYNLEQLKAASIMLTDQIEALKARLVVLLQPVKLIKNWEDIKRLNGVLWRIRSICMERDAAFIATSKCSGRKVVLRIPVPIGTYFKHLFNFIIYLKRSKLPGYAYAYLVKHPLLPRIRRSFEVRLWGD